MGTDFTSLKMNEFVNVLTVFFHGVLNVKTVKISIQILIY